MSAKSKTTRSTKGNIITSKQRGQMNIEAEIRKTLTLHADSQLDVNKEKEKKVPEQIMQEGVSAIPAVSEIPSLNGHEVSQREVTDKEQSQGIPVKEVPPLPSEEYTLYQESSSISSKREIHPVLNEGAQMQKQRLINAVKYGKGLQDDLMIYESIGADHFHDGVMKGIEGWGDSLKLSPRKEK